MKNNWICIKKILIIASLLLLGSCGNNVEKTSDIFVDTTLDIFVDTTETLWNIEEKWEMNSLWDEKVSTGTFNY